MMHVSDIAICFGHHHQRTKRDIELYTSTLNLMSVFFFNQSLGADKVQDVSRRILALAKEMSLLSTDLPTSWRSAIFLRIDDTRMDCMKVCPHPHTATTSHTV